MDQQQKLWHELETSLTALVRGIDFSVRNREIVENLIQNCEYGVALEWLYSAITECAIPMSQVQQREIERLAEKMELTLIPNPNKSV